MRVLSTLPVVLVLLLTTADPVRADSIQTFSLDSTTVSGTTKSLSGDTLTVVLADLSIDGVTFDAVLTVKGSASLTQTSSGLGVDGSGSALLNHGESLSFSMSLANVSGGTASFGGFQSLDFTFFTTSGEAATFSLDNSLSTASDNFLTHMALSDPDISGTSPTYFTLFGVDGTDATGNKVTTSFRVDAIDGAFSTVAAVPEPGSLALIGFAGGAFLLRRWRRRRSYPR